MVAEGLPSAANAFFESGGVAPAEGVQEADVQQLLRCAVGLGGVEDEGAVEAEDTGDGLGQFADGDVFAGANVDQRR